MKKVYHEDCGCGCGCGHDHDHDHDLENEEIETMVLTSEDDTELECQALGVFEFEGNEYIALVPMSGELEDEIIVFGYEELEDDEVSLHQIESDEEYERILDFLDTIIEEEEDEE